MFGFILDSFLAYSLMAAGPGGLYLFTIGEGGDLLGVCWWAMLSCSSCY